MSLVNITDPPDPDQLAEAPSGVMEMGLVSADQLPEALLRVSPFESISQMIEDLIDPSKEISVSIVSSTITDEQVEAAASLFDEGGDLHWIVEACGSTKFGPKLDADALIKRILAAARVKGTGE